MTNAVLLLGKGCLNLFDVIDASAQHINKASLILGYINALKGMSFCDSYMLEAVNTSITP